MALNATRLRRTLFLSSTFLTTYRTLPNTTTAANTLASLLQNYPITPSPPLPTSHPSLRRVFHSTPFSLSSSRSFNDVEKIDPDTILFEGCDYKHWLIVMDFGKDPQQRPSAEEMVETYVQTLAKVVGSVEEAKKRMYACSTTTYTGFQAEIDEDTSKKFEGMPGVIFVLPDSYIDPQNKEYGGDKYINGTIIPRPPPVQYGRVRKNRQNSQQGEGRVFNPQHDYPDRRSNHPYHGPTGQEGRINHMPNRSNYSEQGRDNYQVGGSNYVPPHQGGGNNYVPPRQGGGTPSMPPHQGGGNNYVPPRQGGGTPSMPPHLGERSNHMPNRSNYSDQGRDNYQGDRNNYVPPHQGGGNSYVPPQGGGNPSLPPHQGNYNHGYTQQHQIENFPGNFGTHVPHEQINNPPRGHGYHHPQGQMRNSPGNHGAYTPQGQTPYPSDGRNYAPLHPARGVNGQTGVGSFEQSGAGQYGQGSRGTSGQETSIRYGSGYTFQAENQRFSQTPDEQNPTSTEHRNLSPGTMNQGRF